MLPALLAAPAAALPQQDSIAVIERGVPGPNAWDVAELPFKLVQLPLRLFGAAVVWTVDRAEAGRWLPWAAYSADWLGDRGIYPSVGGQGPNSGTGAELLVGVPRGERFGPWGHVMGGATLRRYWQVEARLGFTERAGTHPLGVEAFGGIERRAEDEFFGIGNDSDKNDRSDFELKRYAFGGGVGTRTPWNLDAGLSAGWSETETGPGLDDGIRDLDPDATPAPGFGSTHRYVSIGGSAGWALGSPHTLRRRGTSLMLAYRWNESRTDEAADFGRLEAKLGLELPFDYRRRSVAFAIRYQGVRPSGGGELPFYVLPTLGGTGTLPSFRSQRFRDRDSILGQVEYRFRVWSDPESVIWLDAGLFLYEGMVARELTDELRLKDLHSSYGLALSLITAQSALGRIELANGGEGARLNLSLGLAF